MANPLPSVMPLRRNTLVPDFDPPRLVGNKLHKVVVIDNMDNLGEAFDEFGDNSVAATGAITITNAGASGDTVTATIRGVSVSVANGGADTATTLATALAAAINAEPALENYVRASSAAGVVTVTAVHSGQIPNGFSFSVAVTGTAAASVTTAWGNGAGNIVTPLETFSVQVGKSTIALYAHRPILATPALRTALTGSGYAVT